MQLCVVVVAVTVAAVVAVGRWMSTYCIGEVDSYRW